MIQCRFRTAEESCSIVDRVVGRLVIVTEDACEFCIKTFPVEAMRRKSRPVSSHILKGLVEDGKPIRRKVKQPTAQLPPAHTVERPPAPVVADPEARLSICTDCDFWIGERCKACTSCRNRPRPLAADGADCPKGFWRR